MNSDVRIGNSANQKVRDERARRTSAGDGTTGTQKQASTCALYSGLVLGRDGMQRTKGSRNLNKTIFQSPKQKW